MKTLVSIVTIKHFEAACFLKEKLETEHTWGMGHRAWGKGQAFAEAMAYKAGAGGRFVLNFLLIL